MMGMGLRQRLCVSICGDKFDTTHTLVNHMLDGITTGATNPNYLDDSSLCRVIDHFKFHLDFLPGWQSLVGNHHNLFTLVMTNN